MPQLDNSIRQTQIRNIIQVCYLKIEFASSAVNELNKYIAIITWRRRNWRVKDGEEIAKPEKQGFVPPVKKRRKKERKRDWTRYSRRLRAVQESKCRVLPLTWIGPWIRIRSSAPSLLLVFRAFRLRLRSSSPFFFTQKLLARMRKFISLLAGKLEKQICGAKSPDKQC